MKKIGINILGYNSKLAKTFIIQYKDLFKIKKFNINTIQNNEYIINFVGSTKKVKLLNSNYYYPKRLLKTILKFAGYKLVVYLFIIIILKFLIK